jgi:glycosyltransferase involved in cell wall biosynthesis
VAVPNGIDMQSLQGEWGPFEAGSLIYTGALTFKINQEAVWHFANEILPLIVQAMPNAMLRVTGKIAGVPEKWIPRHPALHYTGYLDDVRPAIARSWASVVPLRTGSGTRIKIVESMAIGTPVVSTAKGAEGLDLRAGRDLLIADSPADFADATVGLLSNASLRQSLVEQGRQTARARFDWDLLGEKLNRFVEEIAHAQPAAR